MSEVWIWTGWFGGRSLVRNSHRAGLDDLFILGLRHCCVTPDNQGEYINEGLSRYGKPEPLPIRGDG